MKVFISSVIADFESFRSSAAEAIVTLGHQVLRSEDFVTAPHTPQQACLAEVRQADVVVLLVGQRYGAVQESGLSASHEEYLEARERKPILVFIQDGNAPEAAQQAFIEDIEGWTTGHVRQNFSSPDDLRTKLIRSLHEFELATTSAAVDEAEMLERVRSLVPSPGNLTSAPQLVLVVAGGPLQQVLRPSELGDDSLARDIQREALFGDHAVLDASQGTRINTEGNALALRQDSGFVIVDQLGSVSVGRSLDRDSERARLALPAIIVEDAVDSLARSIRFVGWTLERVDPLHRITDVVLLAHLEGANYMPWRTRIEQQANPGSAHIGMHQSDSTATLTPARRHRQALAHDAERLAQDLVTVLRRNQEG